MAERLRPVVIGVIAALVVALVALAFGGSRPVSATVVPVRRQASATSVTGEVVATTTRLEFEPGAGTAPWLAALAEAHSEVLLNAYLLSDRAIISALVSDARRGVRVKVLLDAEPYRDHAAARAAFSALRGTGVEVKEAPARFEGRYAYDHAKYLVVDPGKPDQVAVFGSANPTTSAVDGTDAEDLVATTDPAVVQALSAVFAADWFDRHAGSAPRSQLVLAPGANSAIRSLIATPGPVAIAAEELGDDPSLLAALAQRGSSLRLLLPADSGASTLRRARMLLAAGVRVRLLAHPIVRAKLIVTGDGLFVGSENLSYVSLVHNREVGIVLDTTGLRREALAWFDSLFAHATPLV